jgi:hypothetical protein
LQLLLSFHGYAPERATTGKLNSPDCHNTATKKHNELNWLLAKIGILDWLDWLCWWGETYVPETWPPVGLLFITQVICERGEPWWWSWCCCLGKTPDLSTRALWQSFQQSHLGASRRNGWRCENFAYQYLKYLKGSLTFCKIIWHGACGFTSHLKEGVLQIFITCKNPLPWPSMNSWLLGPVAGKHTNHYTTETTLGILKLIHWQPKVLNL